MLRSRLCPAGLVHIRLCNQIKEKMHPPIVRLLSLDSLSFFPATAFNPSQSVTLNYNPAAR
jgi:hypothetical protein